VDIRQLLSANESEYLDFKREWHHNKAELVHDILSLLNSDSNSDRYLIIGVDDKNKELCDVVSNKPRYNLQNLMDIVRDAKFNRTPNLLIQTKNSKKNNIDIIIIKNSSNKPFFLTTDYVDGKKCVRAGVVYTRNGSTNTPINSSASEYQISKMWEERFGFNIPPIERVYKLLENRDDWLRCNIDDFWSYVHNKFPEYSIKINKNPYKQKKTEWLIKKYPPPCHVYYEIKHQSNTLVTIGGFIYMDMFFLPHPDEIIVTKKENKLQTICSTVNTDRYTHSAFLHGKEKKHLQKKYYYLDKKSLEYLLMCFENYEFRSKYIIENYTSIILSEHIREIRKKALTLYKKELTPNKKSKK
jgi:hypothetical protein